MIKVVALLKRRPDVTPEQFREYVSGPHARFSWSVVPPEVRAGVVAYTQAHSRRPDKTPYDCVTELTFRDGDALKAWNAWYLGPDAEAVRADEEKVIDVGERVILVTDELVSPGMDAGA